MTEIALIGKKIGMTREFYKTGQSVPVTVIKMEKGRIIEVIDEEKRGYKAIQIGFGKIKNSKLSKAMKGYFAKKNTEPKKKLKEFRVEKLEDYMGDVIGDLNSRRGQISTQEQRGNATVITAMVPLANMFGYINSLRSMSQGRAQYSMFFDHYSKVPQNVQDEVTKKIAG